MSSTQMLSEGARKILLDAADFLEKNKWTTGTLAKKANGKSECSPFDKDAKCFCMLGAMARVSDKNYHESNFATSPDTSDPAVMYSYYQGKPYTSRVLDENLHEALVYLSSRFDSGSLYRINDHVLKSKKKVINFLRENAKQ